MARQKSWKKIIFAVQLKQIRHVKILHQTSKHNTAYFSKDMIHVKCMPVFKSMSLFFRNLFYRVFLISNFF